MVATASQDGNLPAEDISSFEEASKTLVVTVFHHKRLHKKGPGRESSGGKEFHLRLPGVFENMQIPDPDLKWWDTFISNPIARDVSRARLKIPQSFGLDYSSFRHHRFATEFESKYAVEMVFDVCPYVAANGERPLKLALFDMDSTLINEEVIDELARSIGISDAVSAITARAMNGDIDFATSLKERVAMLKGVPTTVWEDLKKTVTIAEGARELIAGLKKMGVYTGVVSGGFTPMAEWLKEQLGLNIAVANHLLESAPTEEFPFPHLSGQLNPEFPIVTPELKKNTLLQLSAERSVPLSETLAVGDGSNDLLMLGTAGLGIAWRAKEKVQIAAPMRLNGKSLADLLYVFGPDKDFDES